MRGAKDPGEVAIPFDLVSELVVLAAAMASGNLRQRLLARLGAERFAEEKHRAIWAALGELDRRKLSFDLDALQRVGEVDVDYARQLMADRPGEPSNVELHVERVLWDSARRHAADGSLRELVEALRDPRAEPERVKALANLVPRSFADYRSNSYLLDQGEVVRQMMTDVRLRQSGVQSYSYGVDRLDYYEDRGWEKLGLADTRTDKTEPVRRMIPGAAPGKMTIVTGSRAIGKSIFTTNMVLGLLRNKRKVLYGAWEMGASISVEMLAALSLGWKRSRLHHKAALSLEELVKFEERAHQISRRMRIMKVPFDRARGEMKRGGNQKNLDVLQSYIIDSGCDVFVGDLFARILVELRPEDEVLALQRMQTLLEETNVHGILVHQQVTKGEGVRRDKRPTLEGAKGSAIWGEAADTVIGIHRPGASRPAAIEDDKMEVVILKQRYGKAPMIVEFDWDAETGLICNGVTKPYDYGQEEGGIAAMFDKRGIRESHGER